MDKTAAGQYLDKLFGTREGYVAVAYKDKGQSWQECQFAWPRDRSKLIGWANVHQDANVFVCPALRRDAHTRKKGDMLPTQWLWADVDRQTIPAEKIADVDTRIADIGTYIVSSGSGDNAHVYVQLDRAVDHEEFIKLNTGLRDYLYGDNKQADNSLLRLPGTTNWKTDAGAEVAVRGGNGRTTTKANLMKRRAFRDAKVAVDVDASDWSMVEVEGVPRRVMAMTKMPVDEAVARYGTRHKAVNAIVKELHKRSFDADQIHSLLHTFPPAMDKTADENGYDLHHDIDRCIARLDKIAEATPDFTPEERDQLDDEMPELSDEEAADMDREADESAIEAKAREWRIRKEAERRGREREAERAWVAPPADASWVLTDVLKTPPPPAQYLIGIPPGGKHGLAGVRHNVIITAQFKAGKTRFVLSTIAKALCDGTDFLGNVPVHTPAGGVVVGHWNCEMDASEIAADYIIPAQIENPHNLRGVNLRGEPVDIRSSLGHRWAVQWLRGEIPNPDGTFPPPVKVWTIDSLARLARMAGVSEKDNDEMFDLLMALDRIKKDAGVDVLFLITHTGRGIMEEGKERARGATAIDDWCDARWIMTVEDKVRFLAIDGRGVGLDQVDLVYDSETGRSVMGTGSKADVKANGQVQAVVKVVKANPGITSSGLAKVMKLSQRAMAQFVEDAVDGGFVEVKVDSSGRGRPAKRHYLTGDSAPDGDRARRGTPRVIDLK